MFKKKYIGKAAYAKTSQNRWAKHYERRGESSYDAHKKAYYRVGGKGNYAGLF